MVEVFKTNVNDPDQADFLIEEIHKTFRHYAANFDLEDCDRILRVASAALVHPPAVVDLLRQFGFEAEVLPDDDPAAGTMRDTLTLNNPY